MNAASAAVRQRAPAQQRLGREIRVKGDDAFLFCASFFRLEVFSIASTGCVGYRLRLTAIYAARSIPHSGPNLSAPSRRAASGQKPMLRALCQKGIPDIRTAQMVFRRVLPWLARIKPPLRRPSCFAVSEHDFRSPPYHLKGGSFDGKGARIDLLDHDKPRVPSPARPGCLCSGRSPNLWPILLQ